MSQSQTKLVIKHIEGLVSNLLELKKLVAPDDDALQDELYRLSDKLIGEIVSKWANDNGWRPGRRLAEKFGKDDAQEFGRAAVDVLLEKLK
jgi:hypothetical protein